MPRQKLCDIRARQSISNHYDVKSLLKKVNKSPDAGINILVIAFIQEAGDSKMKIVRLKD